MSKQREHPFEERLRRVEEALKPKATPKGREGENRFDELEFKLKLLDIQVEGIGDLYSQLEELREEVEDLQGQLADAESRIDDLESEAWS
jgi:hypothetical protein